MPSELVLAFGTSILYFPVSSLDLFEGFSPGARLASYVFVAVWAGLLPWFDFIPIHMQERYPRDGLTMVMDSPFMIKVREMSRS